MNTYRIELDHSFDAGHRVVGHKGKCAQLHGHTYYVHVAMRTDDLVEPGFVADFGDIKEIINRWDHKLLLWDKDPLCSLFTEDDLWKVKESDVAPFSASQYGVVKLPFNPTSEHLSQVLARDLGSLLSTGHVNIKLQETPKSASTAYYEKRL